MNTLLSLLSFSDFLYRIVGWVPVFLQLCIPVFAGCIENILYFDEKKKNWLHLPHFLLYVFDWCPHFAFSMHLLVICDLPFTCIIILQINNPRVNEGANPDSKVHGANMGPTWALSVPDGPHVGPMNLAIWEVFINGCSKVYIFRIQVNTSWYTLLYATWVTR